MPPAVRRRIRDQGVGVMAMDGEFMFGMAMGARQTANRAEAQADRADQEARAALSNALDWAAYARKLEAENKKLIRSKGIYAARSEALFHEVKALREEAQ